MIGTSTLKNIQYILNDYSYDIYLLHVPIIYCLYLVFKSSGATLHASSCPVRLVTVFSIISGNFKHWLYQQKIRPIIDRLLSRHTTPQLKQPLEQP